MHYVCKVFPQERYLIVNIINSDINIPHREKHVKYPNVYMWHTVVIFVIPIVVDG